MTALVDTDVLIDILRGTPAAQAWLASVPTTSFEIPGIVAMELVIGCRNQVELQRIGRFLSLGETPNLILLFQSMSVQPSYSQQREHWWIGTYKSGSSLVIRMR